MAKTDNTSSVDKAFLLLEFLAASSGPATLQDVTDAVKLAKPTAYRLLQTLHGLGYVSRPVGSRSYLVGPRAARLACADPQMVLKSRARPLLRRLHEEFNETVNLGILSGSQVLYLDYLETTQPLRYIVTPDRHDPWYCTALGRAAAAQLADPELQRLISATRLRPITKATVRTRAALHRVIERVREEGYAHEIEESVEGVCCLAVGLAPIGFPQAAISVALPVKRLTPPRKAAILKMFAKLITS